MRHRESFCPRFQHAVELVGRRWTGAIARALLGGPLRFSELERAIPGISARALTERLRELEREGIVERAVDADGPIRVRYRLTDKGAALDAVIDRLEGWAKEWTDAEAAGQPLSGAAAR